MKYEADKERASIFDGQRIRQLRREAELHNVDYSRGQIVATEGGAFRVKLNAPLFDVSMALPAVPTVVEAKHAAIAEGEYLSWLVKIQRAERRTVRMGTCGMSSVDIARTPLTQDEIDRYTNRRNGANEIEKLRIQLSNAIVAKARAKAAKQSAAQLNERYGLAATTTCAMPADGQSPALNAPRKRGTK
jgi:hypothetical protein